MATATSTTTCQSGVCSAGGVVHTKDGRTMCVAHAHFDAMFRIHQFMTVPS